MDSPSAPQVVLDHNSLDQLNNTDARSLLDTVDGLRELGVGDLVNLPQIIVVGDQSSGKSSVLEALSRVRFPVDSDLCTRFPTELILRQGTDTAVNVSIQFADAEPSVDHRAAARQSFQRSSFDKNDLPGIIAEAKELMGVGRGGAKQFSKDILRVEIAGPDIYPLTLVDLPGIFHSATSDQDLQDKETVVQLIGNYMRQDKSIILAVVAANNQLALQTVLDEAKKHDRNLERTIGVITKPDLAGRGSANERKYVELAKGRESTHKLALGWYVLRNRSQEERSSEAEVRDTVEERFFKTGEWSDISSASKGVESLRKRLSEVLLDHIRKNLPGLIADIEKNLEARQQKLARLGKSRSTPEELRYYLLDIAERFQRLALDAIEGRYNSDEFFGTLDQSEETAPRKLRAVLRNMNCAFGAVMRTKGAAYKIKPDRHRLDQDEDADDDSDEDDDSDDDDLEYEAFMDQFDVPNPQTRSERELNGELQNMAFYNRGKEFPGDTNPDIVVLLFKKQVAPWENIAQQHLVHVLEAAQTFVNSVFLNVVVDDTTSAAILTECVNPFFTKTKETLREKLQELLLPYTSGYGVPLDQEFLKRLHAKTSQRIAARIATTLESQHPEMFQPNRREGLTRQGVINAVQGPTGSETAWRDTKNMIDQMTVYYEMSLRTFIHNVINLGVESCLVRHIRTILTPRDVLGMDENKLKELASEPPDVQQQRVDFQKEITMLREGLHKCQKHKRKDVAAIRAEMSRLSVAVASRKTLSRTVTPQRLQTPAREPTPSPAASVNRPPSPAPDESDQDSPSANDGDYNGDYNEPIEHNDANYDEGNDVDYNNANYHHQDDPDEDYSEGGHNDDIFGAQY